VDVAFGECELSTDRMELRRAGALVAVEPQVFEVLAHLVAHRDRVVTKHELLDDIWGDRFVSDSALTSRIKTARRLIGDTGRDQRIIKTVHGRGYRFVADVLPAGQAGGTPTGGAADGPEARLRALLQALVAGVGGTVQVVGDGGATADLLDRLVDEALTCQLVVGRSRAAGSGGHPSGVIEALDEMAQRRPDLLEHIPDACRAELERLFAGGLPTTRQRLFVAVRELLVAAGRTGVLLLLDDSPLGDPDGALVEDAARLARRHAVAVVLSQRRPRAIPGFELVQVDETPVGDGDLAGAGSLDPVVLDVLARAALMGPQFDRTAVRAAAGGDEALADRVVHDAVETGVLTSVTGGTLRFTDDRVHEAVRDRLPGAQRAQARADLALQLHRAGAPPDQVATQLLEAGRRVEAVPFALAAARAAAQASLHGEVERWTEAVRLDAGGDELAELLALRADAQAATGAATAVAAYRAALRVAPATSVPGLRARLARTAMLSGDLASADEALDGLELDGGPADGAILLGRGMLAYFRGDLDAADGAVRAARGLALAPGAPAQLLDVITLQGMIAHSRGEWFDRLRRELRATSENPAIATAVFDSHLCVAEYLLYGPTGYDELRRLAAELRAQAEAIGARRAVAFAITVSGEGALLAGQLDDARRELQQAIELHRELGADTGTAHAMQRLAEVELADGDRAAAEHLARRALPLARWSPLARHLLQRIYGTLIATAPDADAAVAVVDEAEQILDEPDCLFCRVMFAVPAAVACAEVGRIDDARRLLATAAASAAMWQGTSWQAATREAEAHLARAEGRLEAADDLLLQATALFEVAGQPLDAERCRETRAGSSG
jgi:DNA-binding winged helix-turn-helix (wHTH) protein